jgi:hypothetical protein
MTLLPSTELEKTSLEAHVDLCAMRYAQLDTRLTIIEDKVVELGKVIEDSNSSMVKVVIGSTATIVASLLGVVVTILMKF